MTDRFPALLATKPHGAHLVEIRMSDLGDGELTIAIEWSSMNYKDALAATGSRPVVRRFPLVCGIDGQIRGRVVVAPRADTT
jgi:acrylyl-CoA reductase (NADPH)